MMIIETSKPKCMLPSIMTVSRLIGNTVTALKESGNDNEMREFISEIKRKDLNLSYYTVLEIASTYVEFHE